MPSDDLILPPGSDRPPTEGAALLGNEAKHLAAQRAGLYCTSCGQSMDEPGWEYFSVRSDVREGVPVIVSGIAYICNRDCCTEARSALEKTAAGRRPWQPWHIFYVEVPDALPPVEPGEEAEAETSDA
jgi:hypothetical protein